MEAPWLMRTSTHSTWPLKAARSEVCAPGHSSRPGPAGTAPAPPWPGGGRGRPEVGKKRYNCPILSPSVGDMSLSDSGCECHLQRGEVG